jgi:hypothetical protein
MIASSGRSRLHRQRPGTYGIISYLLSNKEKFLESIHQQIFVGDEFSLRQEQWVGCH